MSLVSLVYTWHTVLLIYDLVLNLVLQHHYVQETMSYYEHNSSNVYRLMLDDSNSFDHVNYCKLFRILLEIIICHLYCRLLLKQHSYLRARWESTHSSYFNVSNGVKQGGLISPILFCIYIYLLKCAVPDHLCAVTTGSGIVSCTPFFLLSQSGTPPSQQHAFLFPACKSASLWQTCIYLMVC